MKKENIFNFEKSEIYKIIKQTANIHLNYSIQKKEKKANKT